MRIFFILIIILMPYSIAFSAFDLNILVKSGVLTTFTDKNTGTVEDPREALNLQIGYNFPINKGVFRGISLLFDTGINLDIFQLILKINIYKVEYQQLILIQD